MHQDPTGNDFCIEFDGKWTRYISFRILDTLLKVYGENRVKILNADKGGTDISRHIIVSSLLL